MSTSATINDKKYIIHFKINSSNLEFVNLSEQNDFSYSFLDPVFYSDPILNTTDLSLDDVEITDVGVSFTKKSFGYSSFIKIENMTSYIPDNEDFTIYFRVKPESGGLNNLTFDFFNTNFPGSAENPSDQYFKFGIYSGKLQFTANTETSFSFEYDLNSEYTTNKQYHIALSRFNGVIRAYIDGHKVYDSNDKETSETYTGPIFYNSLTNTILDVYMGCNSSSQKIYIDDFTICSGFSFFRYFDFEVPEDILDPKPISYTYAPLKEIHYDLNRIIPFSATFDTDIRYHTEFKVPTEIKGLIEAKFDTLQNYKDSIKFNTIYNLIHELEEKFATSRIIKIHVDEYCQATKRQVKHNDHGTFDLLYRNGVNKSDTLPTKRRVTITVILKADTERVVRSYKRKVLAFVINPLYSRKKGV